MLGPIPQISIRDFVLPRLVSAEVSSSEAAEAAAKSIVKAALDDPRQFLGIQGQKLIRTGWWFGTFFISPYIGNNHPN